MPAIKNKQIKKLILKFLEGKLPSKIKYNFGLNLVNLYAFTSFYFVQYTLNKFEDLFKKQ